MREPLPLVLYYIPLKWNVCVKQVLLHESTENTKDFLLFLRAKSSSSNLLHSSRNVIIIGKGFKNLAFVRGLWPLTRDGYLSCHTSCDTWTQFLRSRLKGPFQIVNGYLLSGCVNVFTMRWVCIDEHWSHIYVFMKPGKTPVQTR